ncbi:MAG: hypothetical protein MEQ07_10280 [Aquimonas sp.]|nr:hypothetical protein [Aquimonas sp.]
MTPSKLGVGALLRMGAGAMVWVSAFAALYAGYSLGCQAFGVDAAAGRANTTGALLVAIALTHAAAMALLAARWLWRPVAKQPAEPDGSRGFRHRVEGLVLGMSSVALVLLVFPMLMVMTCVG